VIARAPAKINLALVVGPVRPDGKHELVTVFQRVDLADRIAVEPASDTTIKGFPADTLVRRALEALDAPHGWRVRIEKRVPVAAGLGGGSSDAGTALQLANAQLDAPFEPQELHQLAAGLGADVPFFLYDGPQLGTGDGSTLEPIDLPQDFAVVLLLPEGAVKASTAAVYGAFDRRGGAAGFDERAARLRAQLSAVRRTADLAALPPNDLAASPLEPELRKAGAFRAAVSGAGPVVYGLFEERAAANAAARRLRRHGATWSTVPVWSGSA
jgi:4-diphosphocytidyl-2-C-methyl-D-erythritol kinase